MLFYKVLYSLPDDIREDTLDCIIPNPDTIQKILKNYKEKKEVVNAQDQKGWQKLLKEEEKELEKLAKEE